MRIPVGGGFAGRVAADRAAGGPRRRRPRRRAQPDPAREGDQVDARRAAARRGRGDRRAPRRHAAPPPCSTSDDVELLQFAADRAAVAIEHARAVRSGAARAPADRARAGGHRRRARASRARRAARGAPAADPRHPRRRHRARSCCSTARPTSSSRAPPWGSRKRSKPASRIPIGGGFAGRVAATKRAGDHRQPRHAPRPEPDPAREGDRVDARRAAARRRRRDRRHARRLARAATVQRGRRRAAAARRGARRDRDRTGAAPRADAASSTS